MRRLRIEKGTIQNHPRWLSVRTSLTVMLIVAAVFLVSYINPELSGSSPIERSLEEEEPAAELFGSSLPIERSLEEEEEPAADATDDSSHTLFPLTSRDVTAFMLASISLMLAAGSGIGGGGILVPLYIIVLSFSPKHAIPLSNVTIFGGAISNLLLNYPKRHPDADRPLIDWNLILIMEPLTLSGAMLGALLNKVLPDLLIVLTLVVLLSYTAKKTFGKATSMYAKESSQQQRGWTAVRTETFDESEVEMSAVKADDDDEEEEEDGEEASSVASGRDSADRNSLGSAEPIDSATLSTSLSFRDDFTDVSLEEAPADTNGKGNGHVPLEASAANGIEDGCVVVDNKEALLADILESEKHPRMCAVVTVTAMFLLSFLVNVAKGGGGFASPFGIECGSVAYWLADLSIFVGTISISLYARSYLLKQARRKEFAGYQYLDTDIRWDERSTLVYPALCTFAGVAAGLCGVGGGIVKAPLMLALGVHPAVASATSATMILFTCFAATTSFWLFGSLKMDYAVVLWLLGVVATFVGQTLMTILIKKTGRNSFIAFCIAGIVAISVVCLSGEWIVSFVKGERHHFTGICSSRVD